MAKTRGVIVPAILRVDVPEPGQILEFRPLTSGFSSSPVKLGYKNTKYLTSIVFLPKANGGYWSDRGYEWYAGT